MYHCKLHDRLFVQVQAQKEKKKGVFFYFLPGMRVLIELVIFNSFHFCHLTDWPISPIICCGWEIHEHDSDPLVLWISLLQNDTALTSLIMLRVDINSILHPGCGGVRCFACPENLSCTLEDPKWSLRVVWHRVYVVTVIDLGSRQAK